MSVVDIDHGYVDMIDSSRVGVEAIVSWALTADKN